MAIYHRNMKYGTSHIDIQINRNKLLNKIYFAGHIRFQMLTEHLQTIAAVW